MTPIREIQLEVCRRHNVTIPQLKGDCREKRICMARHEAMYLCWTRLGSSFRDIGRAFGDRDHTTVAHAVRKMDQRRNNEDARTIPQSREEEVTLYEPWPEIDFSQDNVPEKTGTPRRMSPMYDTRSGSSLGEVA